MADAQVLIIGAGPTGLVLALWLAKFGVRARIIDKTPGPGTTSRALAVQARTLEFYRQMQFADGVVEGGVKVAGVNLWARGAKAARVPLQNIGEGLTPFPFALVFPQDAHEQLLIERLDAMGVRVERRTELVRFDQNTSGVRAVLRTLEGSEELCESIFLAGCDGAHSTVREALSIGFPGGTYSGLFYVADVEASGLAVDRELHVDLDRSDLLLVFPMKSEGCIRLVGSIRDEPHGADRELTFDDVSSHAIDQMKLAIRKVNWFSTYRVHHRVAERFREGRAFLLGDAAHVHSPAGGQGMNTGIGDAVNLAWKLAAVLHAGAPDTLLETYEPERIVFARRLVATTDRGFSLATARGRIAQLVRARLVPVLAPLLFHIPAVRRFMFRTVSQIGVSYRDSPLSAGRSGAIRAGDRFPWVQFRNKAGAATDNFSSLETMEWQLHCHGDASPELQALCDAQGLQLHQFAWTPEAKRAGLTKNAAYVIRPDGYIGMIEADGDVTKISSYLGRWAIMRRS